MNYAIIKLFTFWVLDTGRLKTGFALSCGLSDFKYINLHCFVQSNPSLHCDLELLTAVRKDLAVALRDLLQHGLYEVCIRVRACGLKYKFQCSHLAWYSILLLALLVHEVCLWSDCVFACCYHCFTWQLVAITRERSTLPWITLPICCNFQVGQSQSLVPFGCLPSRNASNLPQMMHAWDLFLKYYETKVRNAFAWIVHSLIMMTMKIMIVRHDDQKQVLLVFST